MSPFLTSFVRTIVPVLVGTILALLLRLGIEVPENALSALVEPIVIAVYYAAARVLEEKVNPAWGKLLGRQATPVYTPSA